jgi:transglutaminase-like putative cysteine protease
MAPADTIRHTIAEPTGGSMDRRAFLKTGATALVGAGLARPFAAVGSETSSGARWRTFEVTTRLEIIQPSGVTRAWVPLPLMPDTDYQKSLGQSWTGNAALTRVVRDEKYGAGIFYAEWPAGETTPVVEVTTRFATHDRDVDLSRPGNPTPEEKSVLRKYTSGTKFIPTDGIVRKQALEVSKGASGDVEKARAVYEWIVENTFRDPKVRGCGLGDIKALLQTGYLGGKCADLNALFVGMVRSLGIPARDIYGVRVTESADYKSLGRSGDISKGQHCRAEFYSASHGWVPVDPADVRKLVLEENGGTPLTDPKIQKARARLFGSWEMNWLAYNYAADLKLPGSLGDQVAFFMYPQAETANERRDSLDPDGVKYKLISREVTG